MDVTRLEERLHQVIKLNDELRLQNESLVQSLEQRQREYDALRSDYESLVASTQTLMEDRVKLEERVAELEAANQRLVDMLWGRRSERRTFSPDQMPLEFGPDAKEAASEEQQEVIIAEQEVDEAYDQQLLRDLEARRRRRKERQGQTAGRQFPEHLERRERVLDLKEEEKSDLTYIGDAVSERLRFEKPHVYVERIVRRKYVAKNDPQQGVLAPPPPLSIVEGCIYDFSVIAAMVSQKFAFHNPTYRQQDWFSQSGWFPSRSTINDLMNVSVITLSPLFDQMWQLLVGEPILLTDDTRLLLLTRNALSREQQELLRRRGRSRQASEKDEPPELNERGSVTSYAWLYTGLEGPAPFNVFHWSLTHQHAVVDQHLAGFGGIVVGDAFGGYTQIEQRSGGRIVYASCNSHARREFVKAEKSEPILCARVVSFYRQLYDVEERGKTLDASGRLALRQRYAVPIWERFGQWLESEEVGRALPQSAFGQAVGYLKNQWNALQRYLSDGRLPIDNDQAEQAIRPLALGRKNWIFLGHPRAAPGRLQLVSIVSSAMRHHLVVQTYLEDVLAKLADAAQHHPTDLELGSPYLMDLLPDRWAAAHPQAVRTERVEEKQTVWELKRARRARQRILARARARSGR
jgi:transposase